MLTRTKDSAQKVLAYKIFYHTSYNKSKSFDEIIVWHKARTQAVFTISFLRTEIAKWIEKLDDLLKLCKDCTNPNRLHNLCSGLGGGEEDLSKTKLQLSDDKTEDGDKE